MNGIPQKTLVLYLYILVFRIFPPYLFLTVYRYERYTATLYLDPVICDDIQFAALDDVHLLPDVPLPAHVVPGGEDLKENVHFRNIPDDQKRVKKKNHFEGAHQCKSIILTFFTFLQITTDIFLV